MKKSKVIIPAMALLLFSTAASITGTVAWFSSTRSFSMDASSFAISEVEGGLEAAVKSGVATEAKKEDGTAVGGSTYLGDAEDGFNVTAKKIDVPTDHNLTHGSFDIASKKAYILNRDSVTNYDKYKDKGTVTAAASAYEDEDNRYKTASDPWFVFQDSNSVNYYVAYSWTIRFHYNFNTETKDVGVYFNLASSSMTTTAGTGTRAGEKRSDIAFRIAFIPSSGEQPKIWMNHDASDTTNGTAGHGYIAQASSRSVNPDNAEDTSDLLYGSEATYDANYFSTNAGATPASDATAATQDSLNKARSERLFTFKNNVSGRDYCDVTCVAWYEGQDLNHVYSGVRLDTVAARLSFYARSDNTVSDS